MPYTMIRAQSAALALAAACAAPLQSQITLGATSGAVHYDSASTTNSLSLNPEARYERRGLVLDASGGYTSGSDGSRAVDAGATTWAATRPFAGHVQLDGLLQGSLYRPRGDSGSSMVLGLGEVAVAAEGRGAAVGLGAVHGTIQGSPAANAVRAVLRAWYDFGVVTATASVEPTRLSGSWFTEFTGGLGHSLGPLDIEAGLRLRQVPGTGAQLGGQGSASWDITSRLGAELGGGRYLRDPFQGLPAGYFVSLGVRFKLASWHTGESGTGVGQASLGDVNLAAAQSFGFTRHGSSGRSVTRLAKGSGGRGTGNGHKL